MWLRTGARAFISRFTQKASFEFPGQLPTPFDVPCPVDALNEMHKYVLCNKTEILGRRPVGYNDVEALEMEHSGMCRKVARVTQR